MDDGKVMPESSKRATARREARAWWGRLGQPTITTREVRAFQDWLDSPLSEAAWSRLERRDARAAPRRGQRPSGRP